MAAPLRALNNASPDTGDEAFLLGMMPSLQIEWEGVRLGG
jgi:hypothetical protein